MYEDELHNELLLLLQIDPWLNLLGGSSPCKGGNVSIEGEGKGDGLDEVVDSIGDNKGETE